MGRDRRSDPPPIAAAAGAGGAEKLSAADRRRAERCWPERSPSNSKKASKRTNRRPTAVHSPARMPKQRTAGRAHEADDATAFDPNEFGNFSSILAAPTQERTTNRNGASAQSSAVATAAARQTQRSAAPIADRRDARCISRPHCHHRRPLKFLIDRTGYIKLLEEEDTPEAFSRIENLRELVNAAMDSRDRGETLDQFLDHAALDQRCRRLRRTRPDHADEPARRQGPGVSAGLSQRPRRRTVPALAHHARSRRHRRRAPPLLCRHDPRHGPAYPDARRLSPPLRHRPARSQRPVAISGRSPAPLLEELGRRRRLHVREQVQCGDGRLRPPERGEARAAARCSRRSLLLRRRRPKRGLATRGQSPASSAAKKPHRPANPYNSIENIAEFFASRGKKFTVPKTPVEEPTGKRGFRPGQKVRHPKYGEGTVYQREGEGEEAKITVQFPRFGLKKLVEKYAQLERA